MQHEGEQQAEHSAGLRLRSPAHQVSPKARQMWALEAASGWLAALILEVLGFVFDWFAAPHWLWILLLVLTLIVAIAHLSLMPIIRYRIHRWESTEEAVYTQSGWLNIEWRIAPISRIQTVDTKRDPFERIFGLSSVTVTTASASGAVRIKGLDHAVAVNLADQLTASTAASTGDAT